MFKVFLILEIAERYVILAMLTITAAAGVRYGRKPEHIGNLHRLVPDVWLHVCPDGAQWFFFKNASVRSFHHSQWPDVLPLMVLIMTIVKVAKKSDAIVTRSDSIRPSPETIWASASPAHLLIW